MQQLVHRINSLIGERRIAEAETICKKLVTDNPKSTDGYIQLARICHMKGDATAMLKYAQHALGTSPNHTTALLQECEAFLLSNMVDDAIVKLANLEIKAREDAVLLQHVAELYIHAGRINSAMRVYKQAHTLIGDDAALLYNTANAAIALGQADEAERLLDTVIRKNPHDYDAYYNRATYRTQTNENNHIDEMLAVLKSGLKNLGGEVQICFALAKEYEDLGEYEQSFKYLTKGADRRKSMLSYDVNSDVETISEIINVMRGDFFENMPDVSSEPGPIFILGMPRSGTTLVDRILSSHSQVSSLGEINDFATAMMNLTPKASSKLDLVRKTSEINFPELGRTYMKTTRSRNSESSYLIDKTPANFLYIGLIAKALPNAKIIHLRRNPMDSCYAMYKTLFRMGYPFSYNLDDLGSYYLAYNSLMAHWREQLPDRFVDLDYETLVAEQETTSKKLINQIGLDWEDDCLNFHKNSSSSSTASAAQIRQPIYKSSVEKWRHYESGLAPLAKVLSSIIKEGEASA